MDSFSMLLASPADTFTVIVVKKRELEGEQLIFTRGLHAIHDIHHAHMQLFEKGTRARRLSSDDL